MNDVQTRRSVKRFVCSDFDVESTFPCASLPIFAKGFSVWTARATQLSYVFANSNGRTKKSLRPGRKEQFMIFGIALDRH